MDFVTPILTPIVESLLGPVKRHLGFLVSSSSKVKDVHAKVTELDGAARDMHAQQVSCKANRRVVPHRVPGWLEEVQTIKDETTEKIPTGGVGCFNLKMRYKAGRDSCNILKHIDRLMEEKNKMVWLNTGIPLSTVSLPRPSTSPPVHEDTDQNKNMIESRYLLFKEAMKSLDPNNIKTQKMALCGMGGVGKTTMMVEMEKAANDRKMFDYIVKVVVGQNPNLMVVQQTVAEQTGETLSETTNDTRARRLKKRFKEMLEEGEKKFLVILDDVWEVFNLEDIGLTIPLPNGFKLLFTSREETVCIGMGVELSSIFRIEVLKDPEDKKLFWETTELGSPSDIADLLQIGEDIIKRCGGLPIAIKTIASTLRYIKEKHEWNHALFCIQNQDFDVIINIFDFSYKNLKEDDLKATFLLSGLFLEDSNIDIEDLVMYGWGLKFFRNLHNIAEARSRVNTYVNKLIRSNLLIKSDHEGCVKMHDLVRDFVLRNFLEVKQASIVNRDNNFSKLLKEDVSYDRILLKCGSMLEFPVDFNHKNLTLLKLMDGHKLLKFPEDFYTRMEKLEVVSYMNMHQPLLPQCSTTLRTLCLRSCSLVDNDVSILGDLINLEVLNLAGCGIHKLPSNIRRLERLKLLDLTGCVNLCIDDGVFENLKQLEELYLRVSPGSCIRFSDTNCDELKILISHLLVLELEFFNYKARPINVSFENLERFRMSIGCLLEMNRSRWSWENIGGYYSFKNTLMIETNSKELRESEINKLFRKTEILYLNVDDMSYLDEILMPPSQDFFRNLKVLGISNCKGLTYLFTVNVAKGLINLEKLYITSCSVLKSVVNGEDEGGPITFQKLNFLSLHKLPELGSLCGDVKVIELPQLMELHLEELPNFTNIFSRKNIDMSAKEPFFNKEVLIPKLEKLVVICMKNLKEIWECGTTSSGDEVSSTFMLRELKVKDCNSLVNIFPSNPIWLLSHLYKIKVDNCGSIEALFNTDLDKIYQLSSNSRLRNIRVRNCESFRGVWMIKDVENNYHFITNFDMRALKDIRTWSCTKPSEKNNELVNNGQHQEINNMLKQRISKVDDKLSTVAFTTYQIGYNFHQLRNIHFEGVKGVEVVFEIETSSHHHQQQQPLLPYLETIYLRNMDNMTHVWKCSNWNEFFILLHKHQPQSSSFQNLTSIHLSDCKSIKYLFSPLMVKLLSNLKEVRIWNCDGMEEVVSNIDDEEMMCAHTATTLFPRLHDLTLRYMKNLKQIGGGMAKKAKTDVGHGHSHSQSKVSQVDAGSWSLCQYSTQICIDTCPALSSVIPYYAAGQTQKLQELEIYDCTSMMEVFETKDINNNNTSCCSTSVAIPTPTNVNIVHKFPNLKRLYISLCDCLENIFTFSTLESLKKLEELTIRRCGAMKVIVKEEVREDTHTTTTLSKNVVFMNLKSIKLDRLPNLAGFFFGADIDFDWPSLEYVEINKCPQITLFTCGRSTAPRLEYIHTELGKHNLDCGLNFHRVPINKTPSEGRTWSFHNLLQCNLNSLFEDTKIFPYHELQQLEKLETISARSCNNVEEVFEVTNNESQTVVKFPNLREVDLRYLRSLKCIWKSNKWRILDFPNLTRLYIDTCNSLEYVFTCSMVGCVMQLQELHIQSCRNMKAVVKGEEEEEDCDAKVSEIIEFPCLKSLKLNDLRRLEGFCLGKEDVALPSLDTFGIRKCPEIKVFTEGHSIIPEQTVVQTDFGYFSVGEDINSFIMTKKQEGFSFGEVDQPSTSEDDI